MVGCHAAADPVCGCAQCFPAAGSEAWRWTLPAASHRASDTDTMLFDTTLFDLLRYGRATLPPRRLVPRQPLIARPPNFRVHHAADHAAGGHGGFLSQEVSRAPEGPHRHPGRALPAVGVTKRGRQISYDAADTGDRINTYYAARGIKLDEEDEKEVKALVRRAPCSLGRGFRNAFAHCPRLTQANELLQPGNALYFDELKSDAVRARGRQRSAQRSAARVNRRPARERTETFSAYRQRI